MKPSLIAATVCLATGCVLIVLAPAAKKWQLAALGSMLAFLGSILAFTSH